jgi:hypothetical protein
MHARVLSARVLLAAAQVAIKFLERGSGIGRGVLREVLNHRLLVAHPNIVQARSLPMQRKENGLCVAGCSPLGAQHGKALQPKWQALRVPSPAAAAASVHPNRAKCLCALPAQRWAARAIMRMSPAQLLQHSLIWGAWAEREEETPECCVWYATIGRRWHDVSSSGMLRAQFRELFLTPRHLAIVMEYAAGGDMFEYVIKNKVRAYARRRACMHACMRRHPGAVGLRDATLCLVAPAGRRPV